MIKIAVLIITFAACLFSADIKFKINNDTLVENAFATVYPIPDTIIINSKDTVEFTTRPTHTKSEWVDFKTKEFILNTVAKYEYDKQINSLQYIKRGSLIDKITK